MTTRTVVSGPLAVTRFLGPALCVSAALLCPGTSYMRGSGGTCCWQTFPALPVMFQFGVGAQCNHEGEAKDFPFLQYLLQNTVQELNP